MGAACFESDDIEFSGDKKKCISGKDEKGKHKCWDYQTGSFCDGYSCDVNLSELVICQTERTAHVILDRLKNNNISAMSYVRKKDKNELSKSISILVLDQYREQALRIIRNLKKSLSDYTICDE
ncbi:MAG: hypothetical protein C4541_13410 [Candidatus Auribacter fodinae]|jgi:hypothetical protein|uniref:Uncharacterized protein n=1 Tax=Candidatus Auribacter fodinae TaxID=2093366 RepID=A0A3A4QZJ6_9BACT|nr:MAG: hypothetical protein C4541_13410 [Candidatus Auribacter fodinae]